jgi:hypothetical protein
MDYGLQYSLGKPLKIYWMNLIIETERAIKLLDSKLQNAYRILVSRKLKQICNSNSNIKATQKRHLYIVNKIERKLLTGNAMLAQADKGRTTVIIYKELYTNKVHNFLTENNIQPLQKNPINKDRKHIQETLKQKNLIFNNKHVKYLLQKSPTPPTLNAQLKLHKPNIPIRPVVNNKNAPTYKIAKKLSDILKQCLYLDNSYNTINSTSLANDMVKLTINNKHRMITYDVKDLYFNIPIDETLKITESQLLKNNEKHKSKQIIAILKTILAQNYFTFQDAIYHPNKGVAMGSPISGKMAEIFSQYIENRHLKD